MLFLLILISGLSWNRHYSPRSGKSDGNFSLSVHFHRVGPPDILGGAAGQVRFLNTFFVGHLTFYIQQAASLVLSPSIRQSISPSPFNINSYLDCHIYGPSGLVWYVDLPVTGPEIIFPTDVTWYDNILTWRDLLNYWTCFNCVSLSGGTAEWKKSLVSNIKGMNKRNIINVIELQLTWWHTHTQLTWCQVSSVCPPASLPSVDWMWPLPRALLAGPLPSVYWMSWAQERRLAQEALDGQGEGGDHCGDPCGVEVDAVHLALCGVQPWPGGPPPWGGRTWGSPTAWCEGECSRLSLGEAQIYFINKLQTLRKVKKIHAR